MADGVERMTRCDCWREIVVTKFLADARIPSKFARAELTTYKPDTDSQREALRLAKKFVEAVGKAIEWSKTTPREQVVERFRKVIAKRKRNEDTAVVSYWHSYGVADPRGRIQPKEFQTWIDWMLRTGELRPGQLELARVYTNTLNQP